MCAYFKTSSSLVEVLGKGGARTGWTAAQTGEEWGFIETVLCRNLYSSLSGVCILAPKIGAGVGAKQLGEVEPRTPTPPP